MATNDTTLKNKVGLATPISQEEMDLCLALERALRGSIPFDCLPNHGNSVTNISEAEACARFEKHLESDLAEYIRML